MVNPSTSRPGVSARLSLRTPEEKDMDSIVSLWTSPDVTQYIGGLRDPQVVLEHFQEYARNPQAFIDKEREWWWSVVELSSGKFIGLNSLIEKDVDDQMENDLGYFLLPSFWGQGYATEASKCVLEYAFREPGFDSLIAIIDPGNSASLSVARKLGMAFDREALRSDGVIRHVYRIRRTDWIQPGT
jgi:RimJ/RimL family protein N-acetyltransferase